MGDSAPAPASVTKWPGQAFVSIGHALYLGPTWDTAPHAHHSIQICCGLTRSFRLRGGPDTAWRDIDGALIPSHLEHQLDGQGQPLVLLYLDPETLEGRRILPRGENRAVAPLTADQVASFRARGLPASAAKIDAHEAHGLYHDLLKIAGLAPDPGSTLDERVIEAVRLLRSQESSRRSLASVAEAVGLSPRRFRQLFLEQMGISGRRYVLWLRIYEAIAAVGRGASLTEAAHAAGFADGAHLGRTFRQTFGIVPSSMAGSVSVME
jgi:AraC-like DNA-binding protein